MNNLFSTLFLKRKAILFGYEIKINKDKKIEVLGPFKVIVSGKKCAFCNKIIKPLKDSYFVPGENLDCCSIDHATELYKKMNNY